MRSEYLERASQCCGATLHRPSGSTDPWFCMDCGESATEDEWNAMRTNSRGKNYIPREYLVYLPNGKQYGRDPSFEDAKACADRLGPGAKIEGLDQMLGQTGDIIYTAQ